MQDSLPIIEPPIVEASIIKVMGVGGGGCNAVNYLYSRGVEDVSFLVCNTDRQALEKSPVPSKLQLGKGLGAGGRPEAACAAAEESRENIREALDDGTQMLFITAGMGGGTGTGASPVVAEIAQEMGILTVGIFTIPFAFEGKLIIRKALRGIARLAQHVDALLVINNEKLRLIYPDFDLPNAFNKSDEVVSNAAQSIAEIITVPGYINTDFQDVYNTLRQGGVAIMNVGKSSDEEHRISNAIQAALTSPLVNNTNVRGAKRILLNFYCSHEHAVRMTELDQINEFIDKVGDEVEVKWGASYDDSLGKEVRVTLIATGYPVNDIPGIDGIEEERRLAYVAITRAMENLTITAARSRMLRGETSYNPISRFVREIPTELFGEAVPEKKIKLSSSAGLSNTKYSSADADDLESENGIGSYSGIRKPRATVAIKKSPTATQPYIMKAAAEKKDLTAAGASSLGYAVGDRVSHMKYGAGLVKDITPGTKDFQVTVEFDSAGQKIMYAGFAKLKRI